MCVKYMGSKSRIKKYVVPFLQKLIEENGIDTYIEPFVGGANIIDKIKCNITPGNMILIVITWSIITQPINKKSIDYIRTKPLHCSQTELKEQETEQDVIIKLKVKINTELEMLIFSYSDAIEVLEPKYLRHTIARRIKNMSKFYKV